MIKHCNKCEKDKPEEEFSFKTKSKNIRQTVCKVCSTLYGKRYSIEKREEVLIGRRATYAKYRDKILDDKKTYYIANSDKLRKRAIDAYKADPIPKQEYAKLRSRQIKKEVIAHYGGVCACCCEANIGFLTVDHINNDGAAHRRETGLLGSRMYNWLRTNKFPGGFQILCFNCNCGRQTNGGICPHKATLPIS